MQTSETVSTHLFAKPLIVGASISADWAALSPGKRLSHRYTSAADVRVVARGGQPGSKVLESVTTGALADRSIVIGLDLFFWDSARGDVSASLSQFRRLIEETKRLGIPLVVGDIPELLAGHQPGRKELNQMIRRAASANAHVFVLPLEDLFLQITSNGTLEIGGKTYSFLELVPDGLHIGDVAADFLADVITTTLASKSL